MLDGYIPPLIVLGVAALFLAARWFFFSRKKSTVPLWVDVGSIVALFILAATLEFAMGRTPFYKHGPIRLWSGNVSSDQNSQQLTDAYTFSHIIHGFLFFGVLWLFARRVPMAVRLAIATTVEAAWEVFENTAMVINRYRAVTISLNYYGDSIVNSMMDILAMVFGFFLASRLPLWITIVLTVIMEVGVAYFIRDNLTLNIIMLIYPIRAIQVWQAGG
jgi:hypothetical protein